MLAGRGLAYILFTRLAIPEDLQSSVLRSGIESFTDFGHHIFIEPRTMVFRTGHPGQAFRSRG
jgi:hypothetical protein